MVIVLLMSLVYHVTFNQSDDSYNIGKGMSVSSNFTSIITFLLLNSYICKGATVCVVLCCYDYNIGMFWETFHGL